MKSGDKYGLLTLIKKVDAPIEKTRKGIYWLCLCECGNECVKHYCDLQIGDTKSCGCLKKKKPLYDKNNLTISNNAGIYGFQNIYNGHWYIGKATNLYNRYLDHRENWKKETQKQFYQAIKKYGWENFNYYILKEYIQRPTTEELSEAEEYYIKYYDSYKHGYNASPDSSGGFYSEEHKSKCTQILNELNKKQKNENHPRTDFTKEEILDIFNYGMLGAPVNVAYEKYKNHKITYQSFKNLYNGEHFKDYLPDNWENRPRVTTNAKLWGYQVIDIKKRFLNGETVEQVYKDYKDKCTRAVLKDIKNNKTYKQIQPCID